MNRHRTETDWAHRIRVIGWFVALLGLALLVAVLLGWAVTK